MDDILGPSIHKAMSRKRRELPVTVSAKILRDFYVGLFQWGDLVCDMKHVLAMFGHWHRKAFERGSYALMCGPISITQQVISRTTTNVKISFFYKVYNAVGVLQWPLTGNCVFKTMLL